MDHLSEPISGQDHSPIYRSKTKRGIKWSIGMAWTLRPRYRNLPSIESDIGAGPFGPDIGPKADGPEEAGPATGKNGPPRNGPFLHGHPISEPRLDRHPIPPGRPAPIPDGDRIDIAPVTADRSGKQSAPECRRAFCVPNSGRKPERTRKAIRTDTGQETKQNERQAKREHTEKEAIHNQKQTKRTSNPTTDRKTSIPTTKAENQKLYLPKRNHGRLAPGFAADAWELRYSAVLWVK